MQGTMQHIARKHGEDSSSLEGPGSPIYAAQVEVLFRQMPWAVLSNFLVSALLSIALWPLVNHVKILSWVAAVFLVSGARWAVGWRYRQRSELSNVQRYRSAYVMVTFLSGVVWGSAAPLFMLDAEAARQLVVALSLMGMVAGAVSSMVAVRWTFLLYTLFTMVPMGLAVFSYHDQVHTTMGVMVVVYVVVMLGMARRLNETVVDFLRLRFNNDVLSTSLESTLTQLQDESQTREQVEKAARESERQLERLANFDTLTGLPNRNLFNDRLSHAVEKAKRREQQLALLFIDLDDFKVVNDTLGHAAGDRMLRHAAAAICDAMRDEDTIARLGGDEFVVLIEEANTSHIPGSVNRLLDCLKQPLVLDSQEITSSASIGIAVYPTDGEDIPTLLKNADTAMNRAKEKGERFQFFQAEMATQARERLLIESNLRRAIEREQLFLNYQPIIDLATGELVGAEALLRWRHPELGLVPPDRFIPVAEASGAIGAIGEWVLRETCQQIQRWETQGLTLAKVAINLSARQLRQPDLAEQFVNILAQHGIAAARIGIELTESALMHDPKDAAIQLGRIRAAGFEIYIDDFGTGYSSLSYLKRFPIDKLKIDRSFVNDITTVGGSMAIVSAVLAVARALGMRVVAEGIETEAQLGMLRDHGCDMGQGYLIGRPMLADDFVAWHGQRKQVPA